MGAPRKLDRDDVVRIWKACRANNPNYTKTSLARFFGVTYETIKQYLHDAVDRGELPKDTFTAKYGRKNKSTDSEGSD